MYNIFELTDLRFQMKPQRIFQNEAEFTFPSYMLCTVLARTVCSNP